MTTNLHACNTLFIYPSFNSEERSSRQYWNSFFTSRVAFEMSRTFLRANIIIIQHLPHTFLLRFLPINLYTKTKMLMNNFSYFSTNNCTIQFIIFSLQIEFYAETKIFLNFTWSESGGIEKQVCTISCPCDIQKNKGRTRWTSESA